MKILILGDTHFGCRNDNPVFYYHFEKFYNMMFQYCIENNIDTIFQLGDLFDKRKNINFKTLEFAKNVFFDKFEKMNIQLYSLTGNHDIFYRESTKLNSSIVLNNPFIKIFDKPYTIHLDNTTIDIVPWICKDNKEEILSFINNSTSDLCFGHLELNNFPMYKGIVSESGKMEENIFSKYELVCTGHYHTKSNKDNIHYVGTPYEMTWMDYNDPKGFDIFDTITRELSFIINNNTVFEVIEYDESNLPNLPDLTNKFLKIIIKNRTDHYQFDKFLNGLNCFDIKILDNEVVQLIESTESDIPSSTIDVIYQYIDNSSIDKKIEVKDFLKTLYIETINGVE